MVIELNQRAIASANRIVPQVLNGSKVILMGWLTEKLASSAAAHTAAMRWKSVYAVVTDRDFLMYEHGVPFTLEEWSKPNLICSLLTTRVVSCTQPAHPNERQGDVHGIVDEHSSNSPSTVSNMANPIYFLIRTGTRSGVETHQYKVESYRELKSWLNALVLGSYQVLKKFQLSECYCSCNSILLSWTVLAHFLTQAAELVQEVLCSCRWRQRESKLMIHYEKGFTLVASDAHDSSKKSIAWRYAFENLLSTSDDKRIISLTFQEPYVERRVTHELELQNAAKPVVFILHSFLAAKLWRVRREVEVSPFDNHHQEIRPSGGLNSNNSNVDRKRAFDT